MSQWQELADVMTTRYSATIELWSQQEKAITEGLCLEDYDAGVENKREDFFGVTTMRLKDTRDVDLTKSQVATSSRWVFSEPYYNQVPVDTADKLRLRVDPASGIGQAQVAAAMRTKDKILIAAATATAYGGKQGTAPLVFPGNGTMTEGNTGYTLGKYDDGIEYLRRYGQMSPTDRIWCLWTAFEEKTFMNILQVSSRDYTTSGNRDKGVITSYGIVDFHRIEDLYDEDGNLVERMLPYSVGTGTGGANVRTAFMGVKKAVRRWTPGDVNGYVWFNGSKDQFEITTKMDCGAMRRLDRGLIAVPCITTAP